MMRARPHNLAWLFCALLLAIQSLLPVSAMASISVRCVGAPSTMAACAQAVVPIAATNGSGTYLAPMSCCRHMHGICPMASSQQAGHAPPTVRLSPLPCLVTVSPLNTEQAAATVSVRQWMLIASPALAPPAAPQLLFLLDGAVAPLPLLAPHFFLSPPADSPGLRAPPVA